MRDDCQFAVEDALGRPLRAGEAKGIEDQVSLQMRLLARKDPQAWSALSSAERFHQGAEAAAKAIIADLKLRQQRVRLQIAAHDRIENALNEAFEQLPDKAKPGSMLRAVSQLLAFDAKAKGLTSAETWANAVQNEALGRLMPLWNSVKGFAGLFENQQGVRDLVHELFGEDSGNAVAKAGAKAWFQTTDELRDRANAAGGDIAKLDEWHYPQSHSQPRIAQAGLDKWSEFTLPRLDRDSYLRTDGSRMSDDAVREFLRNGYDSIITDGQNKVEPGNGRPGSSSVANRQSASRQIFFKDANAYLEYQAEYGDRNLWSTLTGHIRSISRDIALMEALGPNAEQTFRYFNDRTRLDELRSQPAGKAQIDKESKFNEALFDYVAGKREVVNQKVADVGQSFRNFETATKLGKVAITALGDEAGMSATAFANRIPWSEAFQRELKYLNPASGADRETAAHAGLGINGAIGGLNRFGQEEMQLSGGEGAAAGVRNFTSKLATGVMHASGAEAMWDTRRRALGSVLMSYLGKWTREVKNLSDINAQDHGMLANKGVTDADWQVWRHAEPEDWGMKHGVLTPKAIAAIPDEKIDQAIAPKIEALHGEAQRQIDDLNARDAKDQGWINARAEKLGTWVERMKARLNDQATRGDKQVLALSKRLTSLYDQLDTANSYFKQTAANQVNLRELRRAGVTEGRNQVATDQVANKLRQVMRDTDAVKGALEGEFKERFVGQEQEINRLIESGDERKIAFAMDRSDRMFTEANARLTDRLQGADDKLTSQINGAVEKVSKMREQVRAADALWNRANTSRPNFGELRAQGVREGRARETINALRKQIRELTSGSAQNASLDEFHENWDERKKEFEEYVDKVQQRMQGRQQVAERIQRDLEPSIAQARQDARRHAATMLLGHVLEETGMGVMDTGARERVGMTFGTKAGTAAGELTRAAFLFKSFSWSMMMKHWARAAAMPTAADRANYAARILVTGTVLGALATQLRNLASGKDPANVAEPQFWGESFLRGGGLGFYGDFLYSEATSHDTSLIPALMGPLATESESAWNLTGAAAFKAARGERTDEGAKLVRWAKGNIPFANMWYTQAAFDHLIWNNMQEAASPGYLDRVQSKAYAQRGTSWWWKPGDPLPTNGPDFAKAWQPDLGREQLQRIAAATGNSSSD